MINSMNSERYLLVDTDNFGGDYPDEKFVCIGRKPIEFSDKSKADLAADAINEDSLRDYPECPRFVKVVKKGYKLQPGFEP